jgi:hypothetical protein
MKVTVEMSNGERERINLPKPSWTGRQEFMRVTF